MKNLGKRFPNWSGRCRVPSLVVIMMIALSVTSCKSSKTVTTAHELSAKDVSVDSVSTSVVQTVTPVVVPRATAELTRSPDELAALPAGAGFFEKEGRAGIEVTKTADGKIRVSANCDSLTLYMSELETTVTRLSRANKELSDKKSETVIVEVNRLTVWQGIQIWGFRLLAVVVVIFILSKKLWQKIMS